MSMTIILVAITMLIIGGATGVITTAVVSADKREIRPAAYWIDIDDDTMICSECGCYAPVHEWNYCPTCGSHMRR